MFGWEPDQKGGGRLFEFDFEGEGGRVGGLWVGGRGIFEPQVFFSLSNSWYEFFLGHSMNIFLGLIGVHECFFI